MARCEDGECNRLSGQEYRLTITSADELKNVPLEFTNIANGKVMVYRDGKFVMEDQSGSGGASDFINLSDTPSEYSGVGKFVAINSTNDGLEFVNSPVQSTYMAEFIKTIAPVDLDSYKLNNRIIYQVEEVATQEYIQTLPKVSEVEPTQIIILENKSDKNITLQSSEVGETIGGGASAILIANYHMILTPNSTTNNWEITFLGEKFQGEVVKTNVLNSIKSGDNVSIDRSIDGEITINATGGSGTPTDNTIKIEKDGVEQGVVKTLDFDGEGFNVNISGDKVVIGLKPTDSEVAIPQIHEKYDFQVPLNKNGIVEKIAFDDIMISTVDKDLTNNTIALPVGKYAICTNIKIDSKFTIDSSTGITLGLYNETTGIPVIGLDGQLINQTFNFDTLPQDLRLTGVFNLTEDTSVSLRMKVPTLFPVNAYVAQNSGMVISEISNQQGSSALHSFELEHNVVLTLNQKHFSSITGFNESFSDLENFGGNITDYVVLGQYTTVSISNKKSISVTKTSQGVRAYGSPTENPIVEITSEINSYYTGLLKGETIKVAGQVDNTDDYTIHILAYNGIKPIEPQAIDKVQGGEWIYKEGYSLIKKVDVLSGAIPVFSTTFTMPVCDQVMIVVTQKSLVNPINILVNALKVTVNKSVDAYNIAIEPFESGSGSECTGVSEEVVNSIVDTKIGELSIPSTEDIEDLAEGMIEGSSVSDLVDVPIYSVAEEGSVLTKEGTDLVWKKPEESGGGGSTGGEGLTFTIQKVPLVYIEGTNSFDDTNPYQWKSNMSSTLIAYQKMTQNVLIIKTWSNGVVEYYGTLALKYVNLEDKKPSSKKTVKFTSITVSIKCGPPPSGFTYEGNGDTPLGTIMSTSGPFPSYMSYGSNKVLVYDGDVRLNINQTSRVESTLLEGQSEFNDWNFAINFQALLRPTGVSE